MRVKSVTAPLLYPANRYYKQSASLTSEGSRPLVDRCRGWPKHDDPQWHHAELARLLLEKRTEVRYGGWGGEKRGTPLVVYVEISPISDDVRISHVVIRDGSVMMQAGTISPAHILFSIVWTGFFWDSSSERYLYPTPCTAYNNTAIFCNQFLKNHKSIGYLLISEPGTFH